MRKFIVVLVTISVLLSLTSVGFASPFQSTVQTNNVTSSFPLITPCYVYTNGISANLTFNGNTANCSGFMNPSGTYSATITVTLFKKNGNRWVRKTSWSGSSTNGNFASAGGSYSVGSGTYKVTAYTNIGNGLEYPSASVTKTK